jgi:hypothetical protein
MLIGFWWGNQKETGYYKDQDIGERIILKWFLEEHNGVNLSGSGYGQMEGSCGHGNELSGSIEGLEILE